MAQAVRLVAAVYRSNQPIRFNANREVAERVIARIERFRSITDAPTWRAYAVAQVASALDAAIRPREPRT
jgi:hypothetical protein